MESGNGGASSKGVLVPVSTSSAAFDDILSPLAAAYLYEESKQSFRYESAVLIKNPSLEKKYNAFREKRSEAGYSEEELKESFGFLLFDDVNKANELGETGVLTGNSTCTTLGDPSKGVYISKHSDCLDPNRWYNVKSGYIAIIRLTQGRVKKVVENYTQNLTAPTAGFDCHVSEELPSVSAKTSSFLAFERTQYYMYELLNDGSSETVRSPSAACPFAIVSFSYTDTKATLVAPQEKSEKKKTVCHYFPWRGQLQIGSHFYDVGLSSTAGALIPAELPPIVKVDQAISMSNLRQLLPRDVFETCFSGEVFLGGFYCSLCDLVSSETEKSSSLSSLLLGIEENDAALIVPLNDHGFLILSHSSHFLRIEDTEPSAAEVLKALFVFPDSRVIPRETKDGQRDRAMPLEILRLLPVLSYAEGAVEKSPVAPNDELCEVFVQQIQSYAALMNPVLELSPSREVSIFADQYDVSDTHKHLYTSPEWTNRARQNFKSYMSKPTSFQLPVSKATEILAAGQEEGIEDHDDVYFCLSSPEEVPADRVNMKPEEQLTGQESDVTVGTSVDSSVASSKEEVEFTALSQNVLPDDFQDGKAAKDTKKSDPAVLTENDMGTKDLLTPSTSDDLPAELIVSITSAEPTVTKTSLSVISTESATEHSDFKLSAFSTVKAQMAEWNHEIPETKKVFDGLELTHVTKTKRRKLHGKHSKGQKRVSEASVQTASLQTVKVAVEDGIIQKEDQVKESSALTQLNHHSNMEWRNVRKRKFGKLSSKNGDARSAADGLAIAEENKSEPGQTSYGSTILQELEACSLRKKTERWGLKPIISECGRILVPHGSVDIADRIKYLKDKPQSTEDEQFPKKVLEDTMNAHDTVEMEQESTAAPETAVDKITATTTEDTASHLQNVVVCHANPEHSILGLSDDGNSSLTLNPESSEHSAKSDGTDAPPPEEIQEKHADTPSPTKYSTKGEFLLSKLKSVLQRGKRKSGIRVSEQTTADPPPDTEPRVKKSKADSDSEMLKSNEAITSVQDTNLGVKEVSNRLSVDPLFAYALGLTPKEPLDKIEKLEGENTQQRKDSSVTQEQTKPQIKQSPPPIFPRRGRIKTLKKNQGVSEENVKKKWWLHFQTPASFASEKQYNVCTRDNSVSRTVKEKINSACTSTDALNLLADLALGASNGQVPPPPPDPAIERELDTSLKKCDLTKDVTSAEQESVLHALLRQPAARPIQSLESPSPSHLIGGSELVDLVSKEHAYSLPPSSSLLLGLSGTAHQVSPLSGSTRLLHHHQTMHGDGSKTLHHPVDQEDKSEHNNRTQEHTKKTSVHRRKFRHSRTFVMTGTKSVQVTKQWKHNYDFNLDSKFASDSKDRTIIRALHGPWDFSVQDTSEEVRLINHMWIGLFYSRSTPRFFHFDSNDTFPCQEESDSLEMFSGVKSGAVQSKPKDNSSAPALSETDCPDTKISKALDLRKKDNPILSQGSEVLDLSLRNSKAETVTSHPQVSKKETSVYGEQKDISGTLNTATSSMTLQAASTFQFCTKKVLHTTDIIKEWNDLKSTHQSKRPASHQPANHLEQTDVSSVQGGGKLTSTPEKKNCASTQPENLTSPELCQVMSGCKNEKTYMNEATKKTVEMNVERKQQSGSSKLVTDKEANSHKNVDVAIHTVKTDKVKSQDGKNWKVKEKTYQQVQIKLSPKIIHTIKAPAKQESSVVCNENHLENDQQLSAEEPKAVSQDKVETVDKDMDSCSVSEGKKTDNDPFVNKLDLGESVSGLNNQTSPMSDGRDSVRKDSITESNCQVPLDEQQPQADTDSCHDVRLKKQCANVTPLTDDSAFLEKVPHTQSAMRHIPDQPTTEASFGNDVCLEDVSDCITEPCQRPLLDEQPPQLDNKEESQLNLQLRKPCATGGALKDEHTISEKGPKTSSETECISNEQDICLADKAHYQKPAITMFDERTCSLDGSHADGPTPPTNESFENGELNKAPLLNSKERSDSLDNLNTKAFPGEQNVDERKDPYHDKTKEELENKPSPVVIPFIGIDCSQDDEVQLHDSHCPVGEVRSQNEGNCQSSSIISETTNPETEIILPTNIHIESKMYTKEPDLSAGNNSPSPLDTTETTQPELTGSESDDRCPTPTMDENPYNFPTCSVPSSSISALTASEICKNLPQNCLSKSSTFVPVTSGPNPHHDPNPDLQLRTQRVLQHIDKFLSESSHADKNRQLETEYKKDCLVQTCKNSRKYIPACSSPISQELCTKSPSGGLLPSPFSKLEEVLGVRLQQKKTDSSVNQHYFHKDKQQEENCHPHIFLPSSECLPAIKPNIDQDRRKTPQASLSHEPCTYSQRPVMAVKPCKSDNIQADCLSKDGHIETSVMTDTPVVAYTTPAPMLLKKKIKTIRGGGLHNSMQEANELPLKSHLSNVSDSDNIKLEPQDKVQNSKSHKFSSSFPVQSFESAKTSSKLADENQRFLATGVVEKVGQTTQDNVKMDQKHYLDTSTSNCDDDLVMDESLTLDPQSSLTCTVYNTGQKKSDSFLHKISQRCLQGDLTQASLEQECLIYSEEMKQLLKRTKRGPIHQLDVPDESCMPCSNLLTVQFSHIEDQEDSEDHLDSLSLVGQKIKVDMSDRNDLADTAKEEKISNPQKSSQGTENLITHAEISSVTARCARLYTAMMEDVVKNVPPRPNHFRVDRGYPKTEQSNHFDFCDPMKREMDKSFRNNLNSVVKSSSKTKYRFYILVSSDDVFFEETKAQLEAEGHIAVQPSEFFLGEDSSSSLLIILRNEDIAEHICEVPHLLELKKSPGVQFAGIDEPDDVVNFTHQELFVRGGFVMFDRAALESLSLCNMKTTSEILLKLSRKGKWKWLLHYRDSRRLKENARLNAEAKEKKHFLNWCQEVGILEVLPYHECDLMSREQPDYLSCFVRLQVQNISARYPVFLTDTSADGAFGANGILTMTVSSFLTCSPCKTFAV